MRCVLVLLLLAMVHVGHAEAQSAVDRGRYLTEVLGTCGNCHTPKGLDAADLPGKHHEDMRAIIAYLRSLKPIANKVPPFEPKR